LCCFHIHYPAEDPGKDPTLHKQWQDEEYDKSDFNWISDTTQGKYGLIIEANKGYTTFEHLRPVPLCKLCQPFLYPPAEPDFGLSGAYFIPRCDCNGREIFVGTWR
jgi:hypothetical protein